MKLGRNIFEKSNKNHLTFILLRRFVGHDVPDDLTVGLERQVPADFEGVHRDLGELQVRRGSRDALQGLDDNRLRPRSVPGGVERQDGDGIVGVHFEEDERVGGDAGGHDLDLLHVLLVGRQRVVEDLVAEQVAVLLIGLGRPPAQPDLGRADRLGLDVSRGSGGHGLTYVNGDGPRGRSGTLRVERNDNDFVVLADGQVFE